MNKKKLNKTQILNHGLGGPLDTTKHVTKNCTINISQHTISTLAFILHPLHPQTYQPFFGKSYAFNIFI